MCEKKNKMEESPNRAKRDRSLVRYWKLLILKLANIIPISKLHRTALFRLAGVRIEKGVVQIGKVHIDTIHPEDISIGNGTIITDGVHLLTHFLDVMDLKEFAFYRGKLQIGRYCFIGTNVVFTKGVKVGDGVIIGAGSVVNKDIPPYEVWAGVPAKMICKRYVNINDIPKPEEIKLI